MTYKAKRKREDWRITLGTILGTLVLLGVLAVSGCASPPPSDMAVLHAKTWCTYNGWADEELQTCVNVVAPTMEASQ